MPTSRSRLGELIAVISPLQYVAACFLAVVLNPSSFLLVWLTVVIVYHAVLTQLGFVDVAPASRQEGDGDGHALLEAYRRAAPVLATAGLLVYLVDVPSIGEQLAGVLIATGTALILSVKTISFAGTGV